MKKLSLVISIFLVSFFGNSQCVFNADYTYLTLGDSMYFTNTSTNTTINTDYSWGFAGLVSNQENPVFSTSGLGGYISVCLTLADTSMVPACYNVSCDSIYITPDTTCNVQANFTYAVVGDSIIFANTSTNEPTVSDQNWTINGVGYYGNSVTLVGGDSLGYYQVCLTVGFDAPSWCYDTFCDTINTNDSSLFISAKINEKLSVYPNPVKDNLNISITNSNQTSFNIYIYNLVGELVLSKEIGTNNNVNVAYLSKGVYFIKLMNNNSTIVTKKFIKE